MSPFDVMTNVGTTSADNWSDIGDKDYVSFIINRGFSQFHDTIMLAQEMNQRHTMPQKWQYDFYRYAIQPKKKRFSKWAKPGEDSLIELISSAYQVNKQKAIGIRSLLSDADINTLKEKTERGGK